MKWFLRGKRDNKLIMASTNFNTSNQTFRKLMGNGLVYRVPRFQRDYSWTDEEWDDLWQDLLGVLEAEGEPAHYMGYLVLQTEDDRNFDIIDGQQRLTTLTLIVLAVLKNIQRLIDENVEPENNKTRIQELRKTYIGYLDPVSLIATSKLTLNRNNNRFYQSYLVPLERLPQRGLKASEHSLRKCFEWFSTRIQERFGQTKNGAELARFIDAIADKLFFTVITVTDELNAFKVFETLNARGVRLSSTDLLKNYLFSVVHGAEGHDKELQNLEESWESIVGKLGSEAFPDFLRVYWNSKNTFARHSELFKVIRNKVKDKSAVFNLVRELERDADVYAALGNPEDEIWTGDQKRYVSVLSLFGVRQPYSLLLSAERALSDEDFAKLLHACSVISFRYNVIGGLAANEQERVYNASAEKVAAGKLTTVAEIIRDLRSVYPSDEQFRAAFTEKQFRTTNSRNRRVVRYILFQIERHVSNQDFDFESEKYNIEHVLPEHPAGSWANFTDEQVERFVYRLGNMTPLDAARNRDIQNSPFQEKAAEYERSVFEITRRIAAENTEWTVERVSARQRWMADQATSIWRIAQL